MRLFSIVMPVYNKEQYVEAAIRSILNQTYQNFELIVIDDGSKDSSAEVIHRITDKRIRYVFQQNGGESVARNHGISLCKSDFIAFLDSDDLWLPDYLETINSLIEKYPDAGAYGCAYLHEQVTEGTYEKAVAMPKSSEEYYLKNYFPFVCSHEQSLTASTTTVRKEVFDKVGGFPVGLKNWVDLDLWARIGLYYNVAFTERECAIYNDLPNSVSKVKAKLHAPTFDNYKEYMHSPEIPEDRKMAFREYVIKEKIYSAYQQYLLDSDGKKAFMELLPYYYTKLNRKTYISVMIQFLIGIDRFYLILDTVKGRRNDKKTAV